MSVELFTKDMHIIAKLDDEPNDVGGMTAAQLKDKFDEGGLAIKEYINDVLHPALEKGSGFGGHLILDQEGSEMPPRPKLQFADCEVVDEDETTVVRMGGGLNERMKNAEGDISELKQTAEGFETRISDAEDNYSAIDQKVDGIKMEVSQSTAADGKVYSSIELTVGGNTYTGLILMEGNLNVSGQLSADALYAAKGDIADLAVDKLSTSRRIVKHLAGDTSDDNFIRAEDETLAFVSGVYNDGTEQAKTPDGLPLYWEKDIADATIGTDGYPYVGGVRVFTTTGATAWPVTVYTYTELVKARFAFDVVDGYYTPVLTLGAGDGNGNNIGKMMKSVDGLSLLYTATDGKEIGVKMSNDGYTEILGQRAITAIAVTEGTDGSVTVVNTLEGGVSEEIVITPDDSGNPKTLTCNGTVIPITWTEAST